jgi:hypothetical protein
VKANFQPYEVITILAIILLVILVLLNIGYMFTMMPFVQRASKESKRVAQLMSSLPDEMDVETLVIEANGLLDEEGLDGGSNDKKKGIEKGKKGGRSSGKKKVRETEI